MPTIERHLTEEHLLLIAEYMVLSIIKRLGGLGEDIFSVTDSYLEYFFEEEAKKLSKTNIGFGINLPNGKSSMGSALNSLQKKECIKQQVSGCIFWDLTSFGTLELHKHERNDLIKKIFNIS